MPMRSPDAQTENGSGKAGSRGTDILFIQTTDISVNSQLRGQLGFLRKKGLNVAVASSDSGILGQVLSEDQVEGHVLHMERDPSLLADAKALLKVLALVMKLRPRLVVYGTPKASLLGSVASWLLRVPRRVYCVYGLRAETMQGRGRHLMLLIERFIMGLSTDVVAVGDGLRKQLAEAGLRGPVRVLGRGSANGVDVATYELDGSDQSLRRAVRDRYGIPLDAKVVGFVGRITADKGLDTLIEAMKSLREDLGDVFLLLVGPDDAVEGLRAETVAAFQEPWVRRTGNLDATSGVYGAMDVFCLPTRREGLPTVLLEAAASGTPIVATDATGVRDVVPDSECGLVVPIDDSAELSSALNRVLANPGEADSMAENAKRFVTRWFDRERLWEMQYRFYAGPPGEDALR